MDPLSATIGAIGSILGSGLGVLGGVLGGKGQGDDIKKLLKDQLKPKPEQVIAETQAEILASALFNEAIRQMIEKRAMLPSLLNMAGIQPQSRQAPVLEGPRALIMGQKGPDRIHPIPPGPYYPSEAFLSQPGVRENLDILAPVLAAFESSIPINLHEASRGGGVIEPAIAERLRSGAFRPGQIENPQYIAENLGFEVNFSSKKKDPRFLIRPTNLLDKVDPQNIPMRISIPRRGPGRDEIWNAIHSGDHNLVVDLLIRYGYLRPKVGGQ